MLRYPFSFLSHVLSDVGVFRDCELKPSLHAASLPGINSIVSMINSRRRKETFILGSVIAVCTFLLLTLRFG